MKNVGPLLEKLVADVKKYDFTGMKFNEDAFADYVEDREVIGLSRNIRQIQTGQGPFLQCVMLTLNYWISKNAETW